MKIKRKDIIFGVIILCLLLLLKCSHDSKQNIKADLYLSNYNLEAMKDSVKDYRTKEGEYVAQKTSMVTELKDLKKYNDSLYNRVTEVKKELDSRPIIYVSTGVKVIHDTVEVEKTLTQLDDSTYVLDFSKDTTYNPGNGRSIAGTIMLYTNDSTIEVGKFTIDKDEMYFNAEIVFSEKDDKIIASVISKHPGFTAESIQPVVLDPKLHPELKKLNNKRFIIGPYVGVGLGTDLKLAPQIGIGLNYKIIAF